ASRKLQQNRTTRRTRPQIPQTPHPPWIQPPPPPWVGTGPKEGRHTKLRAVTGHYLRLAPASLLWRSRPWYCWRSGSLSCAGAAWFGAEKPADQVGDGLR